ncbi:MAG: putative DNA binding domain-containing protein, partial [Pyramidobacter sp.]|nr:putative DNA binding domain-containing protein [Pyramidobacter sp.]
MNYETENVEFKLHATDDLYREVVAFANTGGGTIYIGVGNDGAAVGLDEVDETYTRVTNGIRDVIQPDVTLFVTYTLLENRVLRVAVGEGAAKPYYLKGKGLKPAGVYVRQGTSSVQASFEQIRRMIRETDGDIFENMRSMRQDLTFDVARRAFQRYGVAFDETKYMTLGLRNRDDGLYTNLALLLSDQCPHTVKVAVFADEANTIFRDAKEFGGSLLRQLEETSAYLALCNRTSATFHGLERVERRDYPDEAVREALLNALVHRDYSYSGSIIINVNDRAMEFISLGGLLPGLSEEDVRSGISLPRNRALAEVFHRLRLIESYGTGIRRIWALYSACAEQPRIAVTPNTFRMILPNMNAAASAPTRECAAPPRLTPQMEQMIGMLKQRGTATEADFRELLNVRRTRAYTLLRQLEEMGLIVSEGRGAKKHFV